MHVGAGRQITRVKYNAQPDGELSCWQPFDVVEDGWRVYVSSAWQGCAAKPWQLARRIPAGWWQLWHGGYPRAFTRTE